MAVTTTPYVSSVHAANFSKEIAKACSEADLKAAAARHSDYLLADDAKRRRDDAKRLHDEYVARLVSLRRLKA